MLVTGSGSFELDVALLQFALSFLGAIGGVRIIDDVRAWHAARLARVSSPPPE